MSSYLLFLYEMPAAIRVIIVPNFLVLRAIGVPIHKAPICIPSNPGLGVFIRIIVAHRKNRRLRVLTEEALLLRRTTRSNGTAATEKNRK